jgi:steroid delta-isomerase-like uncharacterized protein
MSDLTSHAKSLVQAFNDADWDRTRELFDDSTYNELGTQRSLMGADAILEALQAWKAAMPDVRGTVTASVEAGQQVVLEVVWQGTHSGELITEQGTIPPSGKTQRTPAAFVFDFHEGKLIESRHYFDMMTFLRQIGALPGSPNG